MKISLLTRPLKGLCFFLSGNVINKCKYEMDTIYDNIFERGLWVCVILAVFKRGLTLLIYFLGGGLLLQDLDKPSIISADIHLFWPQRKTSPKYFFLRVALVPLSNPSQTRHLASDLLNTSVRQKLGLSSRCLEGLWSNLWCFALLARKQHTPTTPAVVKGDKEDQKVQFWAQL